MLSWSGPADESTVAHAVATGDGDAGLGFGRELLRFTEAFAGFDDAALAAARVALVNVSDESFMVDAAAVAANFEMMTRLADGTGARFAADQAASRAATGAAVGVGERSSSDF